MNELTIIDHPSPNFGDRAAGSEIDMLIIHYTGMKSAADSLARMCDPAAEVSAHYLIDEQGTIYRLVDETARAWHAGASRWGGVTDINSRAIGIELQNPGHDWGYESFSEAQMKSLIALARDIVDRHGIPAQNVLGHSDVSPGRKQDPGHLFDWKGLAAAGIGIWPPGLSDEMSYDLPPDEADILKALTQIGYDDSLPLSDLVMAFQRHWCPNKCDGQVDQETWQRIQALQPQNH